MFLLNTLLFAVKGTLSQQPHDVLHIVDDTQHAKCHCHGLSIITSNRTNSSQTTEQNHHKRPKKHQKTCLALNVTILVDRQRQHEG